ncbi:hypothetical protein V6N13_050572 [Hibiscus sabdariffa]
MVVTLFVQNLPPKLHWSGLKQVFGRHGDIVDSFIARKLDKSGKRFGFVRFSNWVDADNAIKWLNGFRLYGFRLLVAKAKFWRKVSYQEFLSKEKHKGEVQADNNKNKGLEAGETKSGGSEDRKEVLEKGVRLIQGHVEEETLKRLGKCLVGTMAIPCTTKQVEDRLSEWGLGEIVVKRLGGRYFLLEIKDQELCSLLEEQCWSILKEVFAEVEKWSEAFRVPERITWIQIKGIPMHCWNCTTFKRIAELEGTLLSLGENATGNGDCDTVNVLISTKQFERIGETIELEVGRDIFLVQVEELGLHDQGSRHQHQSTRVFSSKVTIADSEENSSEGSSDSCRSNSKPCRSKTKGHEPMSVEDEVIKSMSLEIREKDDADINYSQLHYFHSSYFSVIFCNANFIAFTTIPSNGLTLAKTN